MAKQLQRSKCSGSVYYMGSHRNSWRAVKAAGWEYSKEKQKLIQKRITLGYFLTKDDALKTLINYDESPYDIKTKNISFSETYEKWSKEYFPTLNSESSARTVIYAYNYCTPLHKMRMKDIRVEQLEATIRDADVGNATKGRMKSLFNMLYRYALKHEIVDKDYAALCNPVKKEAPQKEAVPLTQEEIDCLCDNINEIPFVDMILIGIYSGWRPQELAILKTADIDLKAKTMRGGLKTDAGKNRIVPIHPLIFPLIEKRYDEAEEYLFNDVNSTQGVGKRLSYDKYRNRFNKVMSRLKQSHRPHETRHTFITKAKSCNMDEYILKLIVGHAITDITEKVYTHRTREQLQSEINKIKR